MAGNLITFFKSILIPFTFSLLISGCSGKSNNNDIIKALEESLQSSNNAINRSSITILKDLEDKTMDYPTRERAGFWFPKASHITKLTSEAFNYIGGLKEMKEVSSEQTKELFTVLKKYKEDVLNVDSAIRDEFVSSIILISGSFDSSSHTNKEFENKYFGNTTQTFTSSMLTKLQNNIKVIENKTLSYCQSKVGSMGGGFDIYSPIVGQNSKYLNPGDELEITAGIGLFSKMAQPKIIINGNAVEAGYEGFALFKTIVSKKTGNYKIPVTISYFNQLTWKVETFKTKVEYTVAKECDQ